jgi:hypothetical protein
VVVLLLCLGVLWIWFNARAQVIYVEHHLNYRSCVSFGFLALGDVELLRPLSELSILDGFIVSYCLAAVAVSSRSKAFLGAMVVIGIPVGLIAIVGALKLVQVVGGGSYDFDGEQISECVFAFQGYALCFGAVVTRMIGGVVRLRSEQ